MQATATGRSSRKRHVARRFSMAGAALALGITLVSGAAAVPPMPPRPDPIPPVPGAGAAAPLDLRDSAASTALYPSEIERITWLLLEGGATGGGEPAVAVALSDTSTHLFGLRILVDLRGRYLVEAARAAASDRLAMLVHLVSVNGSSRGARTEAASAYADLLAPPPAAERLTAHRARLAAWARDPAEAAWLRTTAVRELAYFRDPIVVDLLTADFAAAVRDSERDRPLLQRAEALRLLELIPPAQALRAVFGMTGDFPAFLGTYEPIEWLLDAALPGAAGRAAVKALLAEPATRTGAAALLARWLDPAAVPPLLEALDRVGGPGARGPRDERELAIRFTLLLLGKYGLPEVRLAAARIGPTLSGDEARRAALAALAGADEIAATAASPFLVDALTARDGLSRAMAARVLTGAPAAAATPEMHAALVAGLDRAIKAGEIDAQHRVLDALAASKAPAAWPVLAARLDLIGSGLDDRIRTLLVEKDLPGGAATRTAVSVILRDKAAAMHPVAGEVLSATGTAEDLYRVFLEVGTAARPLTAPAVARHLAATPTDWVKWIGDPDPQRRLFALVHADLSHDPDRPGLIAGRLGDDDRLVRVWALVRLEPFIAPPHAGALVALLRNGKPEERREALALLSRLSEPPELLAEAGAIETERGDPSLVASALNLCERFPGPGQAAPLVLRARKDDNPWVRWRAADLLERRRETLDAGALDGLARALRGERDGGVARIEASVLCKSKAHLDDVYAAALHPDSGVAAVALDCLAANGGAADWRFARKALAEPVPGAESALAALWLRVLAAEGAGAAAALLDDVGPSASLSFFAAGWDRADAKGRAALGVAGISVRSIRAEALRRLHGEHLGTDATVRALALDLVTDRDLAVRRTAFELLREGGGIPEAVARARLSDEDATMRRESFAVLRIAAPADLAELARDLIDDDASWLREDAALVLRDRGAGAGDVLLIADALDSETDHAVRVALEDASRAVLARLSGAAPGGAVTAAPDVEALARIARAAEGGALRLAALDGLAPAAGSAAAKTPAVVDLLDRLARKDEDGRVRIAALALLERLEPARARDASLKILDKATKKRPALGPAAAVLGRLGDTLEELEALAKIMPLPGWALPVGFEHLPEHRDAVAARVAGRRPGAWEGILADSKVDSLRLLALERLAAPAGGGAAAHAPALVAAASGDRSPLVRRAALDILLAARHPEAERLAIAALDDEDTATTAATMLEAVGGEAALRAIYAALGDEDLRAHAPGLDRARIAIWTRLAPTPDRLAAWARDDGAPALLRYEALKNLSPAALASGAVGSGLIALRVADRDPLVRELAFQRLEADPALAGGPGPALDLARRGVKDDRESVVLYAVRLLARHGGLDDLLVLDRLERKGETEAIRAAARAGELSALERLLGAGASAGGLTTARAVYDAASPGLRARVVERIAPLTDAAARALVIEASGDGKLEVRRAAFSRLHALGGGADVMAAARDRLDDADTSVSSSAAALLSAHGDGADLARLSRALDDLAGASSPRVDRRGAFAGALTSLMERLGSTLPPEALASAYLSALGRLRGEAAILLLRRMDTLAGAGEPFRRALTSAASATDTTEALSWHARKGKPSESRFLAIRLLGRAGGSANTAELLRVARGGGDEDARVAAVEAIAGSGDAAATTELLALASEKVPDRVRAAAFSASLALRGAAGADPVRAVASLGEALDRGDARVAIFAVDELDKIALASAEARPAVAALMRKVLADGRRDPEVRRKAVRVLESAAGRDALADLLARIGDDDAGVRELATEAAFRLRDPASVTPLMGLFASPDAGVRRRVIKILGGLGGPEARGALEKAARGDADSGNRLAAVDALATLEGPEAEAGLVAATFDKVVEVRLAALRALVGRAGLDGAADPTAPPDLVRASSLVGVCVRLARDGDVDVRRESIRVLGAAGGTEHEPVLREVSEKDADFAVRVEAKRALERLRVRTAKEKS